MGGRGPGGTVMPFTSWFGSPLPAPGAKHKATVGPAGFRVACELRYSHFKVFTGPLFNKASRFNCK